MVNNTLQEKKKTFRSVLFLDVVLRNEFIQGCLRDELLRKILAPNTTVLSDDESTVSPNSPEDQDN